DPEKSKSIIEELAKEDPSLATELEEKIFTFEDIIFIKNEDLEKVLKKYSDDKEIAFILKGASDDIKNKFLTCISKRRKDIIEKEIDYLGKVRKEEVLEKRKKFIEYLKEMEKNGEILLRPDKEIYIT
ncbi:MAG TPA: FliG C-terminal domain-containing protein, partial [Spirochaetota bacterium]|nr:FliG C-terminal domain-containing protein [Spirochaetota bacterium]